MYFEELLEKISEPADLAVFFIGFTLGFVVDLIYFPGGIPAGTMAGIISVGLLGLKKGFDTYFLKSEWLRRKRIKKRLHILLDYFSDNPRALETIKKLNNLFNARLIDYSSFEVLLEKKTQQYIDNALQASGDMKEKYDNLFEDFSQLHKLAKSPQENEAELVKLCNELDSKYIPRRPSTFAYIEPYDV